MYKSYFSFVPSKVRLVKLFNERFLCKIKKIKNLKHPVFIPL